MEQLLQYYGLDWLALMCGLTGSWLIGSMRREGFFFSIMACMCGFSVAIMSQQYGFVVYNIVLITFSTRAYRKWGRRSAEIQAQPLGAE